MFNEICTFILLTLISEIKCSVVIDAMGQKGLHVSNYCPKMTYCPEGAHVMCMYHNPKYQFGPRCHKPQNVETTPELAKLFLFKANTLRAEVAKGIAKGKDKVILPRGYGIFRLKWDEELATLAQLLANQCMLKHDLCRSTSRFPDPGQTVGMCRLSHPEWLIVKPRKFQFPTPGLSTEKLIYAINQSAMGWTGQKEYVTPNMILNYPDWSLNPKDRGGKLYMEIISGDARYMGCGVSAFKEFASRDGQPSLFNSILVVCNFSARGRKDSPLYKTVKPNTETFSNVCGCPIGESVEDEDCLCIEKVEDTQTNCTGESKCRNIQYTSAPHQKLKNPVQTCSESEMDCEPTVVLLPIFTVEDAPPHKLIVKPNLYVPTKSSMEVTDAYDNADKNDINHNFGSLEYRQKSLKPIVLDSRRYSFTMRSVQSPKKKIVDVKKRLFNKNPLFKNRYPPRKGLGTTTKPANRKSRSIFSRVQKFQLPKSNGMSSFRNTIDNIRNDVIPRRDFESVNKLVDEYLNSRRSIEPLKTNLIHDQPENALDFDTISLKKDANEVEEHTKTFLNTAEESVINFNQFMKLRNLTTEEPKNMEIKNIIDDSDHKLMTLLNTLEQEVKHVQLQGDKKEFFDAKIRKIYGSVVGKRVDLLKHNKETDSDFLDHEMTNYILHKDKNYLGVDDVRDRKIDHRYEADRIKGFETDKRINEDNNRGDILKPMHSKYDRPTINARRSRFREINSDEEFRPRHYERYTYDGVRNRNAYSDSRRGLYRHRDLDAGERIKSKNPYLNDMNDDNIMSIERRRYYQERLDNLAKRLHNSRGYKRLQKTEPETDHHLRAIRPSRDDLHGRSKNQIDSYYISERARYMHEF